MGRDRRTARHPMPQPRSPPTLPPKRDLRLSRDHSPEPRERWASASGSRPFPSEAWGLHQRQPLGSVASAAAAVSGLNDLTSHDPPSPGMLGSTRTHAHSQPQKAHAHKTQHLRRRCKSHPSQLRRPMAGSAARLAIHSGRPVLHTFLGSSFMVS